MKKFLANNLLRLLLVLALSLVILGFCYFETSLFLKIAVVVLGLIGFLGLKTAPEILILLIYYLGLYDLYNIRYGLAVPLSIIILLVFLFTVFIFYVWLGLQKIPNLEKNFIWVYLITTGLIAMEIFLTMTFWPIDPKLKSLVIVVVFYIIARIFYMYVNNVINLKKIVIFILVSLLILSSVLAFNIYFGF